MTEPTLINVFIICLEAQLTCKIGSEAIVAGFIALAAGRLTLATAAMRITTYAFLILRKDIAQITGPTIHIGIEIFLLCKIDFFIIAADLRCGNIAVV